MNRKVLAAAIAVTVTAIVAAVMLLYGNDRTTGPDPGLLPEAARPEDPVPAGTSAAMASQPAASAPLPADDLPLAQRIPDLQALADAGHRRAACRLGMELLRCTQLRNWLDVTAKNADKAEASLAGQGMLGAANVLAEQRLWQIQHMAQCEKLPESLRSQGPKYLRAAALAGDPAAMLAYAEGVHFPQDGRGLAVGADFDRWRQDAPRMLQAAMRTGNPQAAWSLHMAYQNDQGPTAGLVPNDPYLAFVYHLLVVRLFGHTERDHHADGLDAAQRAQARREASELHRRHYGGRRYTMSAVNYPLVVYQPDPVGPQPLCSDPS